MPALGGYYYGGILAGIQEAARQCGQQLLIFRGTPGDLAISWFGWDLVDGWIVIHYSDNLDMLTQTGRPFVTVDMSTPELSCPAVMADNYNSMLETVDHLIDHGHTRIAFVGCLRNLSIWQRYQGYQAALSVHGIPLDPQLVVSVDDNLEGDGRAGALRLIECGMPCTAVVAGTDRNALGLMEIVQAAGYRIPEDLAVAGFDDINLAQFATSPLTTVRTRFDELGRIAAELLLVQIAGATVPPELTYVPNALVIRRSCGCNPAGDLLAATISSAVIAGPDWQDELASQLVRLALFPAELEPGIPATQIWPGVGALVQGVAGAIAGAPAPLATELDQAWREVVALTSNLELLSAMLRLLARAGAQRLETTAGDADASRRLDTFIDRAYLELTRARSIQDAAQVRLLEELTQNNHQICMTLLTAGPGEVQQLNWLESTSVEWGCLALTTDQPADRPRSLVVAGTYSRHGDYGPPPGSCYPAAMFPPPEFFELAARQPNRNMIMLLPVETMQHQWGVLALCAPVENQLTSDRTNMGMWGPLLSAALERNSLQAEIAEQQATLRLAYEQQLITENIGDLIGMLDQQGRYLYASPSYQNVLGYSPAALAGATLFDYAHPDDLAALGEFWAQILSAGVGQGAFRSRHSGGDWRWLEVAGTAVMRQGAQSVITVCRDITERKRLEAELIQSQKMESIGRLAGGVAHDFNNMLTAIGGYADLAIESLRPGDSIRSDLEEIQKATQRAANLTRQLLAFARRQVIEARVLNLNDLILDMNRMLQRLIGEDINLITLAQPDLGHVRADPGQIEQVLVNLAVNARDAMPNGGKLTIETSNVMLAAGALQHVRVAAGPYVLLAVSDTGVGMSAEVKRHLFEPFFTTKPPGQGTGLGLATCYGIIKQHGGYIWPYSEPEQGATIKIYLPRVAEPASQQSAGPIDNDPLHGSEVVLLVEDEDAVRTLAARVLRKFGYRVVEANDGEHALQVARSYQGQIALLLTDVVMPRMGGQQLAEQLAAARPGIKVLFMSGYTDNALVNNDRLGLQVELLHKPFTPSSLTARVRMVLDA
jgi:PAS domain S-box-containing protein